MIAQRLYAAARAPSRGRSVGSVTIGLHYTAVTVDDGRLGLCYTMANFGRRCSEARRFRDLDGAPAPDLLDHVRSDDPLERSIGVALVNALNEPRAASLSRDDGRRSGVITQLGITAATRVAMVGYFPPVVARLEGVGALVSVLDRDHGMGDEARFLAALPLWPDVLILTATTILNDSFDAILGQVRHGAWVVLMGPSTPMMPEVYAGLPLHMLAGMVAVDKERVLAVVRQGGGTPALGPHCRKVFWLCDEAEAARAVGE